jgi:DNA invertase Pin-like site-specific DNA recombinase
MRLYGPVGLGLLAALDSYGGFLEFGLYLHECDQRRKGIVKPSAVKTISPKVETVNPGGLESLTPDPEKRERLHRLLTLYQEDPKTPKTHIAKKLDVTPTTVYGYLNDLEEAKIIKRNGNGVQVL